VPIEAPGQFRLLMKRSGVGDVGETDLRLGQGWIVVPTVDVLAPSIELLMFLNMVVITIALRPRDTASPTALF
jgi:hypothetical protein